MPINFVKIGLDAQIGIIGAGTMGAGIAQVAATAGHKVILYDTNNEALTKSINSLSKGFEKLIERGKIERNVVESILSKIEISDNLSNLSSSGLVIEAIIENLEVKKSVFSNLEQIVSENCIIASNTSSLSIGSISSACKIPNRVIGLHFFNPANILPLVEIVPSVLTNSEIVDDLYQLMRNWKKVPVIAKDTPGFIVNKVARPYYGEALRIFEEGIASIPQIDFAMKSLGNFKMGPFELMDLIGNDINYKVTETVFTEFYYDSRYLPSITQKRYAEAGLLGRKSGRGFYDYSVNTNLTDVHLDDSIANEVFERILVMLINEAIDTLHRRIASRDDIDLAVTKGVNYPKGLLKWADDIGINKVYQKIKSLHDEYLEERYRPSPLLQKMAQNNLKFYDEN